MSRLLPKLARLGAAIYDKDPTTTNLLYKIRLLGTTIFLLWLSLHLFFEVAKGLSSKHNSLNVVNYREDTLRKFAGSRECDIIQSKLYSIPGTFSHKISPFCKNRVKLLEALGSGTRFGSDEPYVGKECTYRWFSTTEIYMILERFNAISFVGAGNAQAIYAGFNILLRRDLAFGALQAWDMNEEDRELCRCAGQFRNTYCLPYLVTSSSELKENKIIQRRSSLYSKRVPHAFLPINSAKTETSKAFFRELNYFKPSPWQPSPVIFSYSTGNIFDPIVLDEWLALASGAERNIPFLYLGPHASEMAADNDDSAVLQYHTQLKEIAKEKHFDLLNLYNLTLPQVPGNVEDSMEEIAIVEAMMVINWLSKLETS